MKVGGCGIILVKHIENEWKILGLIGPEHIQKKSKGVYDIPKGLIDDGEGMWECARRECIEEAGIAIENKDLLAGPKISGFLSLWLAKTDLDPVILPNPSTGLVEHTGWKWLDFNKMESECYSYLKPFIVWAKQNVKT